MDFFVNGVLKIVWFVIYGPIYLAAAMALAGYLLGKNRRSELGTGLFALFFGSALIHLALSGHVVRWPYFTHLKSLAPVTLASVDWPQSLLVTSAQVSSALVKLPLESAVPIVIYEITDYGCIRSFQVDTVGGIDVRLDSDASWVWKLKPQDKNSEIAVGPGSEDRKFPWCWFRFYGGA
jgi:hypothetical protein